MKSFIHTVGLLILLLMSCATEAPSPPPATDSAAQPSEVRIAPKYMSNARVPLSSSSFASMNCPIHPAYHDGVWEIRFAESLAPISVVVIQGSSRVSCRYLEGCTWIFDPDSNEAYVVSRIEVMFSSRGTWAPIEPGLGVDLETTWDLHHQRCLVIDSEQLRPFKTNPFTPPLEDCFYLETEARDEIDSDDVAFDQEAFYFQSRIEVRRLSSGQRYFTLRAARGVCRERMTVVIRENGSLVGPAVERTFRLAFRRLVE